MLTAIVLLPLLGFVLNGLLATRVGGNRVGPRFVGVVGCGLPIASFVLVVKSLLINQLTDSLKDKITVACERVAARARLRLRPDMSCTYRRVANGEVECALGEFRSPPRFEPRVPTTSPRPKIALARRSKQRPPPGAGPKSGAHPPHPSSATSQRRH